jgi:hypothetical protein
MPWLLKLNSLVVLAMGATFCCYFMYAKHDLVLSPIIPFANDPYDSVGSFAAIVSVLLGCLAFVRAFRPYRKNAATAAQRLFLARTLMAIVLAVLIALAANVVAMGRHPAMWMGRAGTFQLLALTAGIAILASGAGYLTHRVIGDGMRATLRHRARAAITILVSVAVLALFPEIIIRRVPGELIALATGIVFLFLPMSALVIALIPYNPPTGRAEPRSRLFPSWLPWVAVILLGIAIGSFFLLLEAHEGAGIPAVRVLLVAAVFIGAGTAGLVTGYAFLRKPLGL